MNKHEEAMRKALEGLGYVFPGIPEYDGEFGPVPPDFIAVSPDGARKPYWWTGSELVEELKKPKVHKL